MARLEPLLLDQDWLQQLGIVWVRANDEGSGGEGHDVSASIDFVWETIATKNQRAQHREAAVLNRLSGAQVRPILIQTKIRICLPLVFSSTKVALLIYYGILQNPFQHFPSPITFC